MTAPYYEEAGCAIFCGDCTEVLQSLEWADHLITDPPYSTHVHSKSMRGAVGWKGDIAETRDLGFSAITDRERVLLAAWCARSVQRWIAVFSDTESAHLWAESFVSPLEYVRTAFWRKVGGAPQFTGDRPAVACEAITLAHREGRKCWNGGGKQGIYEVPIVLDRGVASATEWRCHTTQKPERLMEALIADFTDAGDLIIDPFMGSGTTLVACKRLARRAIGIELNEKYCEVAANRLRQAVLPLAVAPEATQADLLGGDAA